MSFNPSQGVNSASHVSVPWELQVWFTIIQGLSFYLSIYKPSLDLEVVVKEWSDKWWIESSGSMIKESQSFTKKDRARGFECRSETCFTWGTTQYKIRLGFLGFRVFFFFQGQKQMFWSSRRIFDESGALKPCGLHNIQRHCLPKALHLAWGKKKRKEKNINCNENQFYVSHRGSDMYISHWIDRSWADRIGART